MAALGRTECRVEGGQEWAATGGPGRRPLMVGGKGGPFRLHLEVGLPVDLPLGRVGRREAGGVLWSESGV